MQVEPFIPSKYVPRSHQPFPPQQAFLVLPHREALFGGAAGPGKTDAMLMAALQYVHVPGYAALLMRRTLLDLKKPGSLLDRARNWLAGTDARWVGDELKFVFPSGAVLQFGAINEEWDHLHWQSAEFTFIGIDELTQWPEHQYTYMFSRLRKPRQLHEGVHVDSMLDHVPLRMRAATNPGGPGHQWVSDRFIPAWYIDGEAPGPPKYSEETGEARIFIPARIEDNPAIDRKEYEAGLMNLDPITRRQLMDGDWTARADGGMFQRENFVVVDFAPLGTRKIRAWDYAVSDPRVARNPDWTAGALVGLDPPDQLYIFDVRRMRGVPAMVDRYLAQTNSEDNRSGGSRIPVYVEEEKAGGRMTTHHFQQLLRPTAVFGIKLDGDKIARAQTLASWAGSGKVHLVRGGRSTPAWHKIFVEEAEVFPLKGNKRDQVDAVAHAVTILLDPQWASGPHVSTLTGAPRARVAV